MIERFLQSYVTGTDGAGVTGLHFAFGALGWIPAVILLCLATAAAGIYAWRRLGARVRKKDRVVLTTLRAGAVALTLFLLLDPSLVGRRVQPGEQMVALLFDDSMSMRIAGGDGASRGERLQQAYRDAGADAEERIRARFPVVRYGFGLGVERLDAVDALAFDQPVSDPFSAVDGALSDLAGAEVAAVVLFSDGVPQPTGEEAIERVAARGVPVFTVGVGTAEAWRDVELAGLSVKRSNFDKSPVVATVRAEASGLDKEPLVAEILDQGRVVASEEFQASGSEAVHEARLEFVPTRKEWIAYEARVRHRNADKETGALPSRDRVEENNRRAFLVDNRDKEYRILYLTGSPTWENKFYRRALEADKQLRVTSLVRISRAEKTFVFRGSGSSMTNPLFQGFDDSLPDQPRYDEAVFLRLGPDGSELTTGYPDQPEDLFGFHLVIWGDIEHNFFSSAQLELTRAFVLKRGGTLLLLGGPRSFAEGGFGNTVIDGMLPVVLRATRPGARFEATTQPFEVRPTEEGVHNGAWVLDPSPERNREMWEGLLGLFGLNRFTLTRAGASVMATVSAPDSESDGQPFFAIQPYGEGRCAVLATGQTWPWHMREPEEDSRFDRLWRQITRSLVEGVPEPVALRAKSEEYPAGEPADLEFVVRDARFVPREGLRLEVRMTTPGGESQVLEVEESLREAGVYTSRFVPEGAGSYAVSLSAVDETGAVVGALDERLTVVPDLREYRNAQYNPVFLRRLAEATGGRHFELNELEQLADYIPVRDLEVPNAELERWRLWHWPPFLVLLTVLLSAEWYLRRKKGQA